MIKKKLIILTLIVLIGVISIVGYLQLRAYIDFLDTEKLAIEYIDKKYDFNFELIDSEMGKSQFPAPRTHKFIFYDIDNKLYFFVDSYDQYIRDHYDRSTTEKIVFE